MLCINGLSCQFLVHQCNIRTALQFVLAKLIHYMTTRYLFSLGQFLEDGEEVERVVYPLPL